MADPDVPVLAVVGAGPGGRAMREVLHAARRAPRRRGDGRARRRRGRHRAAGRSARSTSATRPLLDILPLQRLALALALARGEDPDAPRGLKKVTATM